MTQKDEICLRCGAALPGAGNDVDPCLGYLPGVLYACCGHGDSSRAYVMFLNGMILRGFTEIESPSDLSELQLGSFARVHAKHGQTPQRSYTQPRLSLLSLTWWAMIRDRQMVRDRQRRKRGKS